MEIETRVLDQSKTQLRLAGEGTDRHLIGYAVVFNQLSEDMGGWRERVLPGALDGVLNSNQDVWALSQHDRKQPIGRRSKGTLNMTVDDYGLLVDVALPDNSFGRDLIVSIEHGDLDGMSFGFVPALSTKRWVSDNGQYVQELESVALDHISPVTQPAYSGTVLTVRSQQDFEQFKLEQETSHIQKTGMNGMGAEWLRQQLAMQKR